MIQSGLCPRLPLLFGIRSFPLLLAPPFDTQRRGAPPCGNGCPNVRTHPAWRLYTLRYILFGSRPPSGSFRVDARLSKTSLSDRLVVQNRTKTPRYRELASGQQHTVTGEADWKGRVPTSARTHFDTLLAFTGQTCLRRVYTILRSYLWAIYVRSVSYPVFHN